MSWGACRYSHTQLSAAFEQRMTKIKAKPTCQHRIYDASRKNDDDEILNQNENDDRNSIFNR